MRLLLGWIAGLATAWAILAIWQRIPALDEDPALEYEAGFAPRPSGWQEDAWETYDLGHHIYP